jgi:hypothetical protein
VADLLFEDCHGHSDSLLVGQGNQLDLLGDGIGHTQDELPAPIGFFERSKWVSHDQLVGLSQLRQAGKEIQTGRDWSLPHVAVVVGSNICLHP